MSENASTMPPKGLWNLRFQDLWKGFIKSCGGLIVGLVIKEVQNKFQPIPYDQIEPLLEASAYFFLAYVGLNYSTNNVGQLFKQDKATITVDAAKAEAADIPPKAPPYSAPNDSSFNK